MSFRKLPSDEWRQSHRHWATFRLTAWRMGVVGLLMAGFSGFWPLIEFVQPPSKWDKEGLVFLAAFFMGSAALSFVGWLAYRCLGRREPPE